MEITKLKFPSIKNPAWVQLACLLTYTISARAIFNFERPYWVVAGMMAWGMALDLAISYFKYRTVRFPLSAWIICSGLSFHIASPHAWVYFLIVTLAMLSKGFLHFEGKHFINPTNFGFVTVLLFGGAYATGAQNLFSGYLWPTIIFYIMGLTNAYCSKILLAPLTWLAGFAVFGVVRWQFFDTPVELALGPLLSPGLIVFSFHMITDPATVPRSRDGRIKFGIIIAAVDAVLRVLEVPYGTFYALFVACCCGPYLKVQELEKMQSDSQQDRFRQPKAELKLSPSPAA